MCGPAPQGRLYANGSGQGKVKRERKSSGKLRELVGGDASRQPSSGSGERGPRPAGQPGLRWRLGGLQQGVLIGLQVASMEPQALCEYVLCCAALSLEDCLGGVRVQTQTMTDCDARFGSETMLNRPCCAPAMSEDGKLLVVKGDRDKACVRGGHALKLYVSRTRGQGTGLLAWCPLSRPESGALSPGKCRWQLAAQEGPQGPRSTVCSTCTSTRQPRRDLCAIFRHRIMARRRCTREMYDAMLYSDDAR